MTIRNCFTASLLFCLLTALATAQVTLAQGTPGGKTPIIAGFTPLSQEELQKGTIRLFDGFSTFGWKGANLEPDMPGVLYFSGGQYFHGDKLENTPFWFFVATSDYKEKYATQVQTANAFFRIELTPDNTKPLFDGTTLTGWTIRGNAEAVVENETIKLTKGSGSLESDGKYGDFI